MVTTSQNEYVPLIAEVTENKNKSGSLVAFVQRQLCFFERDTDISDLKVGDTVEVMLTRGLYKRHPEGHEYAGRPNWNGLVALIIDRVDPEKHKLITTVGFTALEDKESPIRATTTGNIDGNKTIYTLGVGKTGASRANVGGDPTPIRVWVDKDDLTPKKDVIITTKGLTRLEDGSWWRLISKYYKK
jgi:hypothetical protein